MNFFEKTDKDESLMDIMRPRDGNAARLSIFHAGEIDTQLNLFGTIEKYQIVPWRCGDKRTF